MTLTRELAIANVPDADKRREAERLYSAASDAADEFYEACAEAEIDSNEVPADRADLLALKAAYDAAHKAWSDFDCSDVSYDHDYCDAFRCALTGFLIHDDDVFLIDENSDERVLKIALGWPLDPDTSEFVSPDTQPTSGATEPLATTQSEVA